MNVMTSGIRNRGGALRETHLVPLIFPLLTLIGETIFHTLDSPLLLILVYFLALSYGLLVTIKWEFDRASYAFAIFCIGLSFTLMVPLRGILLAGDGPEELRIIKMTVTEGVWDPNFHAPVGATSIHGLTLPILQLVTGVDALSVFRFAGAFPPALTGVVIFLWLEPYVGRRHAFLLSLFLLSQAFMIFGAYFPRHVFSLLFLSLTVLTLVKGRKLWPIFAFALSSTYYATAYFISFMLLVLFLIELLLPKLYSLFPGSSSSWRRDLTSTSAILIFFLTFTWYSQEESYSSLVGHLRLAYRGLNELFNLEIRGTIEQKAFGYNLNLADTINLVVMYFTIFVIVIGCLAILSYAKRDHFLSETRYKSFYISSMAFSLASLFFSFFSFSVKSLGVARIWEIVIFFMLPGLIVGAQNLAKIPKLFKRRRTLTSTNYKQKVVICIIVTVIGLQLVTNTGITYHLLRQEPLPVIFNSDGRQYNRWYAHEQELIAAKWLVANMNQNYTVYGDHYAVRRVVVYWDKKQGFSIDPYFFDKGEPVDEGYIFLDYQNVVKGEVAKPAAYYEPVPMKGYINLVTGMNRVFSNGASIIYSTADV